MGEVQGLPSNHQGQRSQNPRSLHPHVSKGPLQKRMMTMQVFQTARLETQSGHLNDCCLPTSADPLLRPKVSAPEVCKGRTRAPAQPSLPLLKTTPQESWGQEE